MGPNHPPQYKIYLQRNRLFEVLHKTTSLTIYTSTCSTTSIDGCNASTLTSFEHGSPYFLESHEIKVNYVYKRKIIRYLLQNNKMKYNTIFSFTKCPHNSNDPLYQSLFTYCNSIYVHLFDVEAYTSTYSFKFFFICSPLEGVSMTNTT